MSKELENEELAYNLALQERLKLVRALKGWTQADAGTVLGMTEDAYQQMETREGSAPTAWHIERLRKIAQVDIAKLDEPIRIDPSVAARKRLKRRAR